jgi:thymidylate synthase
MLTVFVRVYWICYILYIIDCHIYHNIFDMMDIMYCTLSYVFECVLPLKTLVLYIYRSRDTTQYILPT